MGCYRYQDVPTVPIEGLFCLLWDVPESRHRRVIKSLQDRSLLDCEGGDFWLHPVLRAEGISRLRNYKDWELSNRKSAEFWTKNTTRVEKLEDAIKAFESYYHYLEIKDFDQIFNLFTGRKINNNFARTETLAFAHYRLGVFQQMTLAIERTIENTNFGYPLAKLHNILGNLYWLKGLPQRAIESHEQVRELVAKHLDLLSSSGANNDLWITLMSLEAYSLGNIAFCKISLWELEEAASFLKESIVVAESINDSKNERHLTRVKIGFAYLKTFMGFNQEACKLLEETHKKTYLSMEALPWDVGYHLVFLSLTYINLGEFRDALDVCSHAIKYSDKTNYTQIKGLILNIQGQIFRKQEIFEKSIANHLQAIALLDKIGAKCDLAETHYHIGLTYQTMDEFEKSQESFQEAIRLFNEMEAPKQVERVKRSMQNQSLSESTKPISGMKDEIN